MSQGTARGGALTSGADFLLLMPGARPDGMGQAYSAIADDINTLTYNPAGLASVGLAEVGYGRVNFPADIHYDFVGLAIPAGSVGAFGIGYVGLGVTPFNSTLDPSATPVSAQDVALMGGFGKSFDFLDLGVGVNYVSRQVDTLSASAVGFNAGARYRLEEPRISISASLLNLGPAINLGSAEALPLKLDGGVAWQVLHEPLHSLTLASDGFFYLNSQTQQVGVGMEYWYRGLFALRSGWIFNSETQGFTAGAGLRIAFMEFDYAFQPLDVLGAVHRFSGVLRWDGPWAGQRETAAPQGIQTRQTADGVEIKWTNRGGVEAHELEIKALDGSGTTFSKVVQEPPYLFRDIVPGVPYQVTVRFIGAGGVRGEASRVAYFSWAGGPVSPAARVGQMTAQMDAAGLKLSWPKSSETAAGYHLYRKSPAGDIQKATLALKRSNEVWVADPRGREGWTWIVSEVSPGGKEEKVIASTVWRPLEGEPTPNAGGLFLKATGLGAHKVRLGWEKVPGASGYSVLYSVGADGIYEEIDDLKGKPALTATLSTGHSKEKYQFMVTGERADGSLISRTQGVEVIPSE